jgi:hypothetical protein
VEEARLVRLASDAARCLTIGSPGILLDEASVTIRARVFRDERNLGGWSAMCPSE